MSKKTNGEKCSFDVVPCTRANTKYCDTCEENYAVARDCYKPIKVVKDK